MRRLLKTIFAQGRSAILCAGLLSGLGLFGNHAAAQPANDNWASAQVLSGDWGSVTNDNTGATAEPGEPNHAGVPAVSSIWYAWTAPSDGEVTVDTVGTGFSSSGLPLDTVLAVYSGTNIFTLRQNAANDDAYPNSQINLVSTISALITPFGPFGIVTDISNFSPYFGPSIVRFNAKAGMTYYFAVDTKFGDSGPIQLNWAYHSSGAFRFATEDMAFDLTGGFFVPFYRVSEAEALGTGDESTTGTYYNYNVPGVLVTITRTAGSTGRMLVDYATEDPLFTLSDDLPATAGLDYAPVQGTLAFDDFEMSKSIVVQPLYDGGFPFPNRDFMITLSNARPDPNESPVVSQPRIDPVFGTVLVRILDTDIDPYLDQNFDTNNMFVGPTNSVFNFEKTHYDLPEDVQGYWTSSGIWVFRSGTNTESVTLNYRINNELVSDLDPVEENNNLFPLQPSSDYATPNPPSTASIHGQGPDFDLVKGTLAWGQNDFLPKRISFNITNDDIVEFNEDFHVFLYRIVNNAVVAVGTVNDAAVTILFDDNDRVAGSVDQYHNADFGDNMKPPVSTVPSQIAHPGTDGVVYNLFSQADGKTVIVGNFFSYNSTPRNGIARMNTDGSLDFTFNPGSGANDFIGSIAATANNQFYIAGGFTSYNGVQRPRIARINANGSLDATFNAGAGPDASIWAIALQNDGNILIAGEFTSINGTPRAHIARLNSDGTLDTTFDPGTNGPDGTIWTIALQTNGKILIGGEFITTGGLSRSHIARLNTDGSVDGTFNPGTGTDGIIYSVALQPDGKVWIGGEFGSANLVTLPRFGRLNANGSVDTTFSPGIGADATVYSIAVQNDGSVYVGGSFSSFNGTHRLGFVRLFTDGTVDTGFLDTAYNQFAGLHRVRFADPAGTVYASSVQPDGNVLIAGDFNQVGGGQADIRNRMDPNDPLGYTNNVWTEPKARDGLRNRSNVARLIGGSTPGPGNVGLLYNNYSANEAQGFLSVNLSRQNGTLGYAAANFSIDNGIPQAGIDYGYYSQAPLFFSSWELTLPATTGNATTRMHSDGLFGTNTVPVDLYGDYWFNYTLGQVIVSITNDTIVQGNRSTTFELANPSAADIFYLGSANIPLCAGLGQSQAPFTIVDDDHKPGVLTFSLDNYSTNENAGSATITVIRTNGSFGSVSVAYATYVNTTNGTAATPGSDYVATNGSLTFGNGQTSKTFSVRIIDDSIVEDDEIVGLRLFNAGGGATLGSSNSVLTILDNDSPNGRLNFTTSAYSTNENSGFAVITVKRSGGSQGTLSVSYKTSDNTAVSGRDYTGVTNVLTWNPGDTTPKTFVVPLLDNLLVDGNRSLNLDIFAPTVNGVTNLAVLGSTIHATLTILDDDTFGSVAFSSPVYYVNENGGPATVTVVRHSGVGQSVTVNFVTVGGTAPLSSYSPTNGVLAFAPGEIAKSFTIPINDNPFPDGNRTIGLILSNATPVASLGFPAAALLNIIDDESVNEPPGSPDTGTDPGMDVNNSVLGLSLQADGKILLGGDFTVVNNALRSRIARLNADGSLDGAFATSQQGANGTVRSIVCQTDGRILVGGSFSSVNRVNRNHYARMLADGTVDTSFNPGAGADNDVFAFAETFVGAGNRRILMGGSFLNLNGVSRNGIAALNNDGSLDSNFNPGSGVDGAVYAILPYPTNSVRAGQILIAGEFSTANGVNRTRIARLKVDGSVDLTFDPQGGPDASIRALALQLDEHILAGGLFTNYNGTIVNHIVRLNPDGSRDPSFDPGQGANDDVFSIAIQRDNRILLGGQFTLANGITRHGITRLNTDGSPDPMINFGLGADSFISSVVLQPDEKILIGGGFTQFDGVPRDHFARLYGRSINGSGEFEFSSPTYQVSENGTNAVVAVRRRGGTSGNPSGDVFVTLSTSNGTAQAGINYVAVNTNLDFPPGEVFRTIAIPVFDDALVNVDRTVVLNLSNPQPIGGSGAPVIGDQSSAVLTIVNDDSAISFASANYFRNEDAFDGVATIGILRYGSASGSASVSFFTTTNGTAVIGVNYFALSNIVTFAPGQTSNSVRVPVIHDPSPSGNKTVVMQLSNVIGSILLAPSQATLTVLDVDHAPGQFYFSTNAYFVGEADTNAYITINRTNGSSGVVSVRFATTNGTALAGVHYFSTNGTLTFADGEVSKQFTIPIINDNLVQGPRTLNVILSNPSGGALLIGATNAPVTILDDDVGVAFSSPTYTIGEGGGAVTISVLRLNGSNGVVTVNYATTNSFATNGLFATAGADYLSTTGVLTFANGETLKTFNVPILEDSLVEGDETFGLVLSNLQPPGQVQLINNTATVTILDDDAGIMFSNSVYSVSESGTNVILTVLRTNAITTTNSIVYFTSDGTATAGSDYAATSGLLTFNNGESVKTIVVPILQDTRVEGDETFFVTLTNAAGGAQILSPNTSTVTIVDDDSGLSFSAPNYSVNEAGVSATITVLRSGVLTNTVSVSYATSDGTANTNFDYIPATGSLTFTNGETAKTFAVQVIDNTIIEGDHTVLLKLFSPVGQVSLLTPSAAVLTIVDNDGSLIVPAGAAITGESGPVNSVIDAGERVTLLFALRNSVGTPTANLVATLLATNGIAAPSPASQSYGVLVPAGPSVSRPFSFTAAVTNGASIAATFQLQDGTTNLGFATFSFSIGTNVLRFTNSAPIAINDHTNASPYPSTINVSGLPGVVTKASITLSNLSHTHPADIDTLLVSPGGQNMLLLANNGGGNSITNVVLTLDDTASVLVPIAGQIVSGTNRPNPNTPVDTFPAPAPPPPYTNGFGASINSNPNGVWSLFIIDDTTLDSGSISKGWILSLTTASVIPNIADLTLGLVASSNPVVVGSNLVYSVSITNAGPSAATHVNVIDQLPAGVSLVSASPSGYTLVGNVLTFTNLGALSMDGTTSLTITVMPTATGSLTNLVTVQAAEADPNLADNSAISVTTAVAPSADLVLDLTDAPDPVGVGENLIYTLNVSNSGPATATSIRLTNTLPGSVNFVSASPSGYSRSGSVLIFTNLNDLGSGGVLLATITVQTTTTGTITNNASVGSSIPDPLKGNNSASAKTIVGAGLFQLTISRSGNNIVIAWPASASGFVLESTLSLSGAVTWTQVTSPPPQLVGNQMMVTIPAANTGMFFRLHHTGP